MAPYTVFFITLVFVAVALAFPQYASLAGLSDGEIDRIIPTLNTRDAPLPPGPLTNTSSKLVNDPAHPWKPLQPGDIRGPCPGLNTLASHGASVPTLISNDGYGF
jgi:hypothetical protein